MNKIPDTFVPDTPPVKMLSIWWIIALGVLSAVFSLSMFFLQASRQTVQVSGKIVTIMDSSVMIVNARGEVTNLLITPETKINLIKVTTGTQSTPPPPPTNEITNLQIGQFIHAFGQRDASGLFKTDDIRVIKQREPKVKN